MRRELYERTIEQAKYELANLLNSSPTPLAAWLQWNLRIRGTNVRQVWKDSAISQTTMRKVLAGDAVRKDSIHKLATYFDYNPEQVIEDLAPPGTKRGWKLTDQQVKSIRAMHDQGLEQASIARVMNVSRELIRLIVDNIVHQEET